ncbi:hypothetical protein HUT19_03090 [Streptomyces sp. NA02950]|uniref:DUF6328 family protein n=1 Tax=Streptomyces sp. NA02950 TaxID=2742137 RepID=UPI0015911D02|nr:DUF6328 family protein [Streptomyces sp. NA02950]QKV90848.1 hypothetical protein HUT19_03090 [Streptomyces sp. NA02950]
MRNDDHRPTTGRSESAEERADRKWAELLQEVRVTQTGVQILFAFLLTVAFTPRFTDLGSADRAIYVVTVLLGAAATGALIAPVSLHRIVAGRRLKPETVAWASRFTLAGLVLLLCTVTSALLLILRVVVSDGTAFWLVAAALLWFAICWFVPAVWLRRHSRTSRPSARNRSR